MDEYEYSSYLDWITSQLFEYAYNPLALYELMQQVAGPDHENYEASQAAKDALTAYLAKVEQTGCYPYPNLPGQKEQYGRDIEELKRRLAAVQ